MTTIKIISQNQQTQLQIRNKSNKNQQHNYTH